MVSRGVCSAMKSLQWYQEVRVLFVAVMLALTPVADPVLLSKWRTLAMVPSPEPARFLASS